MLVLVLVISSVLSRGHGSGVYTVYPSVPTKSTTLAVQRAMLPPSHIPQHPNTTKQQRQEECGHGSEWVSCFKYKTARYLQDLFTDTTTNISEQMLDNLTTPYLVTLPDSAASVKTTPIGFQDSYWSDVIARAADSNTAEMSTFLIDQLDKFLSGHGVVIPVTDSGGLASRDQDMPMLMEVPQASSGTEARGKLKKHAVLFPLMILFKFFKIKMVLIPMLVSVLFIKKMLIFILASAPSLMRLFSFCRPMVPQFPQFPQFPLGLQPAGILQDVTDNRAEFTSMYGMSSPYREQQSYRTRAVPPDMLTKNHPMYTDNS